MLGNNLTRITQRAIRKFSPLSILPRLLCFQYVFTRDFVLIYVIQEIFHNIVKPQCEVRDAPFHG